MADGRCRLMEMDKRRVREQSRQEWMIDQWYVLRIHLLRVFRHIHISGISLASAQELELVIAIVF